MGKEEIELIRRLYLETPLGAYRIAKLLKRDKAAILFRLKDIPKLNKNRSHNLTREEQANYLMACFFREGGHQC